MTPDDKIIEADVKSFVSIIFEQLTYEEIVALNLAVQLGIDPRNTMGYEKAKSLFTNKKSGDIPIVHPLTKRVFFELTVECSRK